MAKSDWRHLLAQYLIASGVNGRTKAEITKRYQALATADQIDEQLIEWQELGKADKYNVPKQGRGGRPVIVWRATTKMLED